MSAQALLKTDLCPTPLRASPNAATSTTSGRMVTVACDAQSLASIGSAWEDLAADALEPNALYEPWMLLPALAAGRVAAEFLCVLVWARDASRPELAPRLDGLFPFERARRFRGLPARTLRSWHPPSWRLCTPLVRRHAAAESLAALLDWLDEDGRGSCAAEFRYVPCDGPFHGVLADVLRERPCTVVTTETFTRSVLRKETAAADSVLLAWSGKSRRKLRRKEKRLNERGMLTHVALEPGGDVEGWIDHLLRLEMESVKGRQGLGLGVSEASRGFAREVLIAAFQRGRLQMAGIDFDGWPIARRCSILAGEGAFAFCSAYDDAFAHFSPGVMAEVDGIRAFAAHPQVQWMDSVWDADGSSVNRLWKSRRVLQSLLVGTGAWGEMWTSMLPILKGVRRRLSVKSRVPVVDKPGVEISRHQR